MLSATSSKWRITFVDTGLQSTIGERLKAVEPYLGDDEVFLATYGDGLTDAPLPSSMRTLRESGRWPCSSRSAAVQRPHRVDRRRRERRDVRT